MELTNREAFFKAKELIKNSKNQISDSEIYQLLIVANSFYSYTEIVENFDKNLAKPQYFFEKFDLLIEGKPIQYITNIGSFLDFDFYVDERVLIPRPETEGLVLLVKNLIESYKIKHKTIVDLCTGSGCIAIYMKGNFEESKVYATDLNDCCLEVAKLNANKFNAKINFLKGDKTAPLNEIDERIDVLVSNPPYISKKNEKDVEKKVFDYEPHDALFVENGTEFYEDCFKNHKKFMNDDKFLMAFEINYDQKESLTKLINQYFGDEITYNFYQDIYNMDRYLVISKGYKIW